MLRCLFWIVCFVLCAASSNNHFANSDIVCKSSSKCMMLPKCTPFMDLLYVLDKPLKPSVVDFLRSQQCGFKNGFPKVCCASLPKTAPVLIQNEKKLYVDEFDDVESSDEKGQSSSISQTTLTTTQKPVKKTKVEKENLDMEKAFEELYDDVYMFDILQNTPEELPYSEVEIR